MDSKTTRSTSKTFRITKYCKWFESTNRNTDTRKNKCRNQLTDTQKKLDEATAENSSLKQYIQKLEKAKDEVEDTADKSQQIVEEHLRK